MISRISTSVMLLQVDEPADVRFRRGMTRIRLLEKAKFWMLDTVRRSGKKIEEHSFAKASLLSCGLVGGHRGQLHLVC